MPHYIVTVKFPKNPEHNPKNKVTGKCAVSDLCTDVTGEHHSYLTFGESETDVRTVAGWLGRHVTRIERV